MRLALALLLLPGLASAKCAGTGVKTPADYEALRACQDKERQALIDSVFNKSGTLPTTAQLDALDERQRQEASAFLKNKTVGASDMDLATQTELSKTKPSDKSKTAAKKDSDDSVTYEGELKPAAGMTPEDLASLKASLGEKSDHGKKGVTKEMAGDIRKMLQEKQGGVSPDMERLLNLTSRDGANLTTETMQELRKAGKEAKGQGLDLGISPDAERQLLIDDLTPAPGQAGPGNN
jgi:hypothetical protein